MISKGYFSSYKLKTMHILDTNSFIDLKDDRLMEKYNNIKLSSVDKEKIFRKLMLCIKEHQNAIELVTLLLMWNHIVYFLRIKLINFIFRRYANLVESLFSKSILVQLFCNVITLTIGGVEVSTVFDIVLMLYIISIRYTFIIIIFYFIIFRLSRI